MNQEGEEGGKNVYALQWHLHYSHVAIFADFLGKHTLTYQDSDKCPSLA